MFTYDSIAFMFKFNDHDPNLIRSTPVLCITDNNNSMAEKYIRSVFCTYQWQRHKITQNSPGYIAVLNYSPHPRDEHTFPGMRSKNAHRRSDTTNVEEERHPLWQLLCGLSFILSATSPTLHDLQANVK